jgi:hypothetical protein
MLPRETGASAFRMAVEYEPVSETKTITGGATKVPKQYDEGPDLALVATWLGTHGLITERFSQQETKTGKTPDFRVKRGNSLVAYCEVKSPNDPWLDEQLEGAPPFAVVGGGRQDPTFNRLARLINKAGEQFTAVNRDRSALNILAYVNHAERSGFRDLQEVLTGHFHAADGMRYPTMLHISNGIIGAAKQIIDAFVWFDGASGKLRGIVFNKADNGRRDRTCTLLGVDPAKIERA